MISPKDFMNKKLRLFLLVCAFSGSLLTGCSVVQSFVPTTTPTATAVAPTPTLIPPTPTITPTATEVPFFVTATYFTGDLQVPILIYHRFFPDQFGPTTSTEMQLSEFKNELKTFYDNGFSLVSLKSWIDGTFIVPEGIKPLILTIDDGWSGDQLFINADGTPSDLSGIGILWNFSREHPDFGFHIELFAIMGDKYYADKQVEDRFLISDGQEWFSPLWRQKLGQTIAWAIENGVGVYNHTLTHPDLSKTENAEIQRQLLENDWVVRDLLDEVGREDLVGKLDNLIALPEGKWPSTNSGKNIVLNYKNPEREPVIAVMEAYNLDAAQFTPSYFSEGFNPFAIPRITATPSMTSFIVENKDLIPTALTCKLGPLDPNQANDSVTLIDLIRNAVLSGNCGEGVYHVNNYIFLAKNGEVTVHYAPQSETPVEPEDATPQPTP